MTLTFDDLDLLLKVDDSSVLLYCERQIFQGHNSVSSIIKVQVGICI